MQREDGGLPQSSDVLNVSKMLYNSDSVYRLRNDHAAMSGFPPPCTNVGEIVDTFIGGQMMNADGIWKVESDHLAKDSCQQLMEGIPFPSTRFSSFENQDPAAATAMAMSYTLEDPPFTSVPKWDLSKLGNKEFQPRQDVAPTDWFWPRVGVNSNSPGTSGFSNELSLSLSTSVQDHYSEFCSWGATARYALHRGSDGTCSSSSSNEPSLVSGSRFFQAMREILADIARYSLLSCSSTGTEGMMNLPCSSYVTDEVSDKSNLDQELRIEATKKSLLALLQVVDDRYSQCLDEVHTVVSAFHAVTQLDPNLHARFALPTISLMFKSLRERMSSHILAMGAQLNEEKSFETSFIQKQWALQQLSKADHHLWRPQRGLPEKSVSILRAWMFQNFLHPYPKDAEKHILALRSGLTRSQVSNWFINARVRLWKPMIEEMYAEMNRRRGMRNEEGGGGANTSHAVFEDRRFRVD